MCSRKDYEAIAAILQDAKRLPVELGPSDVADEIAGRLAGYFQKESPTFNSNKFLQAATIEA